MGASAFFVGGISRYTAVMEPLTRMLVDWIEIPSITGDEEDYGDALSRALVARGFDVERQEVEPGRYNVLARTGRPEVVFCTHLDTVPPFIGSRVDADFVHGRGSCDAKGQAAAMLVAAEELLKQGEDRVGFLFTVGEELDSIGAAHANAQLAEPWAPRYVIIGEPTDSTFVRAAKGLFKARLVAEGVAGHSSQDIGPSAVHELVCCASRLLSEQWGAHDILGVGTVNLGQIEGGVAPNVVAAHAAAQLLIRSVEEPSEVEARIRGTLGDHVRLECEENQYAPIDFHVPEGEESCTVAFGTDAPHMPRWGTPVLFGAGSIRDAHTPHEKIGHADLLASVGQHIKTVQSLLGESR